MLGIVVFIEYNGRGDDQSGMVLRACSTRELWAWETQACSLWRRKLDIEFWENNQWFLTLAMIEIILIIFQKVQDNLHFRSISYDSELIVFHPDTMYSLILKIHWVQSYVRSH